MAADPRATDRIETMRAALDSPRAGWGETGEVTLDTGVSFGGGEPVRVRVRKRWRRYDLDDQGVATAKAGRPHGWLEAAERVVAGEGLNVNRAGVVFVPAVEGRDLAALASKVADTSLAVYDELLELPLDA